MLDQSHTLHTIKLGVYRTNRIRLLYIYVYIYIFSPFFPFTGRLENIQYYTLSSHIYCLILMIIDCIINVNKYNLIFDTHWDEFLHTKCQRTLDKVLSLSLSISPQLYLTAAIFKLPVTPLLSLHTRYCARASPHFPTLYILYYVFHANSLI